MYGFPIGNGNAGLTDFVEKFTNNANSGFPTIQQREVFYSVRDGVWTDSTMWQTASGRVGITPTINDDVYIRHTVSTSTGTGINNFFCNNLFNTGRINFINVGGAGSVLRVNGNINSPGILDMSAGSVAQNLILCGDKNTISNSGLITGSGTSRITYARLGDQEILNLQYNYLYISNITNGINVGKKYATSDIVCNVFFLQDAAVFDLSYYNLTCNSTTAASSIGGNAISPGTLYAAGSYILFKGPSNIVNADLIFDQNVIIEFQNGVQVNAMTNGKYRINNCIYKFTTNNQSITGASSPNLYAETIIIDSAIQVTVAATVVLTINGQTIGNSATSKLINQTTISLISQNAAENFLLTGITDFTTTANTIQYAGNYSATISSYITNYHNLTISGTGTKTLGVNTTLNGNLTLRTSGVLQLSTYDFTVNGTTDLNAINNAIQLLKSGSGNVLFVGSVSLPNQATLAGIDFSAGNPNVELRNGIGNSGQFLYNTVLKTGTGTWTFTTNNQSITSGGGSQPLYFDCPILISGAISLTNATNTTLNSGMIVKNSINGNNASSTFINKATLGLANSSYITPMSTGVFDISSFSNVVGYVFDGTITLPNVSTYKGLWISGSGIKTLQTNTTVNENLTISNTLTGSTLGDGSFELSTYNLTVNGTTTQSSSNNRTTYAMTKSGSGTILFVGNVNLTANARNVFDFSGGNPNVEFRGGVTQTFYNTNAIKSGTGTWTFSTNNQTFSYSDGSTTTQTLDCAILISGAITLTITSATNGYILKGTINGDNSSSKLLVSANTVINYQNATQPMVTGILDTSTNANTWIYGSGNQDIKGGPTTLAKQVYRNLTLNGGGTKTLQGYVSVQNTYTLTSPATLALNGYTLTNP